MKIFSGTLHWQKCTFVQNAYVNLTKLVNTTRRVSNVKNTKAILSQSHTDRRSFYFHVIPFYSKQQPNMLFSLTKSNPNSTLQKYTTYDRQSWWSAVGSWMTRQIERRRRTRHKGFLSDQKYLSTFLSWMYHHYHQACSHVAVQSRKKREKLFCMHFFERRQKMKNIRTQL